MRRRPLARAAGIALGACLACACAGPAAVPEQSPLLDARFAPIVPDDADLAAAALAEAALAENTEAASAALLRIERFDTEQEEIGEERTGLAAVAQDAANAAAEPGRAYLTASEELRSRGDAPPELRERLRREEDADHLTRAGARVREARVTSFARLFNAVVEPVGRSITTTALAPIRLGASLARWALERYREDPLPLQRRQALAEWKEFLARYPDAPESPEVSEQAARAEERWRELQTQRALDAGQRAQEDGRPGEALELASRALRLDPKDRDAERLRERAQRELDVQRESAARSIRFELPPRVPLDPPGARDLILALLTPGGDVEDAVAAVPAGSPIADEARFAQALAAAREGREHDAEDGLEQVARGDGVMARHARVALADPVRNPWRHFEEARHRDRLHATRYVLAGPTRLPKPTPDGVALWLLDLPRVASTLGTMPIRAIELPWLPPPPTARATALQARRYLALRPRGAHAEEVRAWLEGYEDGRGNHVAALRVAEAREPLREDLEPLREEAARQTLEVAKKEERLDLRAAMLDGVLQRFPQTKAGGEAKELLRDEIDQATPQRIAIRRGFLLENPEVAGVRGLGLDPTLLDDDARNGELHPDGVALIGGRRIELAFLAPSGDEDDPPERRSVRVGEEQLARLVARLEETSFRNSLLDSDDPVVHDARRDLAFERARLGLADRIDRRPEARAEYTYRGMRERYGVVRGREAWLPFDLVVQGSLADLSLGAFPRWREPKKSPDAVLFE